MGSLYQIDKLEDMNYDSWAVQMRSVLMHAELWKLASGALKEEDDGEGANWRGKYSKALTIITLSVKQSKLGYIKNSETSFAAWKKLKTVHQLTGPVRKVSLYKMLLSLQMFDGQNVCSHFKAFCEISEKLTSVGIDMPDELKVIILLSSLPNDYENFVVAIETRDVLPEFEILYIKVKEEGERRSNPDRQNGETHDFTVNVKSSGKKTHTKNIVCFNWGKRGHIKAECRSISAQKEKKRSTSKEETQKEFSLLGSLDANGFDRSKWCLDSGATSHMCCNRTMFNKMEKHTEMIGLAGDSFLHADGKGEVKLQTDRYTIVINNVLYVPDLKSNFLTVSQIVARGYVAHFSNKHAKLIQDGECILMVKKVGNLYTFEGKTNNCFATACVDRALWHKRYGHLNFRSLTKLTINKMVRGMEGADFSSKVSCKTCMLSKIHVQPFPHSTEKRASKLLAVVHSDVCGPFETKSLDGNRYFLSFMDDVSTHLYIFSNMER